MIHERAWNIPWTISALYAMGENMRVLNGVREEKVPGGPTNQKKVLCLMSSESESLVIKQF